MSRSNKFDYQALMEKELIAQPGGLSLDQLLARCGFNVDRSTLFRHLVRLIEKGRVERVGSARASRYRPLIATRVDSSPEQPCTPRPAIQDAPEFAQRQPPNQTPFLSPNEVRQAREAGDAGPESVPAEALGYNAVVKKAVRTVVREWKRCTRVNLQIYLSLLVKPEHLNEVSAVVEKELSGLHQGNLAEFGLSPADFSSFIPPASREATGE